MCIVLFHNTSVRLTRWYMCNVSLSDKYISQFYLSKVLFITYLCSYDKSDDEPILGDNDADVSDDDPELLSDDHEQERVCRSHK